MRTLTGTLRAKTAIAVLAFMLATPALFAAPSVPYVCYKPADNQAIYPWDRADWWYDSVSSSTPTNRAPTTNDHVFVYSNKNNVNVSGRKPMVVTNGVHAATGNLEICDSGNNPNNVIGITVQDGGTMFNAGYLYVGNSGSGKTGGGRLTVESGGVWNANSHIRFGCSSGTSWLNVKQGGTFWSTNGEFMVGFKYGSGIVTNEGTMTLLDLFPGNYGTGVVVNKGDLTIDRKLTIGRYAGSTGRVVFESGSTVCKRSGSSYPVYVGFNDRSTGFLECYTDWKFSKSDKLLIAHGIDSTGRMIIGEGGVVSVTNLVAIGEKPGSSGTLELRGGTLKVVGSGSDWKVFLGESATNTTGRITGWGAIETISNKLRIMMYGQVIADGEGMERDLNLSHFRTVGTNSTLNLNVCGTNGWFSVNKGRLIYPRSQDCSANKASHPTIGDYPTRTTPNLMNSFTYTLVTKPNATYYNFAELYAPDRTDIPEGLPLYSSHDVVAGVWRFGLSSVAGTAAVPTPISFGGMRLTFRYDWRGMDAENQSLYVYRHDGSAGGSWTRVGKAEISSTANTITTDAFDASSETWNAGWFAVVAQRPSGMTVILR